MGFPSRETSQRSLNSHRTTTRRAGAEQSLADQSEPRLELKNGLRAGDVWVPGSRQFKDFEEYLLRPERFAELRDTQALPVALAVSSRNICECELIVQK